MAQQPIYALEGDNYSLAAYRTITADDTATPDVSDAAAFINDVPRRIVYGAGSLKIFAGHNASGGSIVVTPAFYNKSDALIYIGAPYTLSATALRGDLLNAAGGAAANYYLTDAANVPAIGVYGVRLFVNSIATSTTILLYVAHDDGFLLSR